MENKLKPKVMILTGYGINADRELLWAFELAGGNARIVHLEDLIENESMMNDHQILAFPGGFSFGDHISSGKVYANIFKHTLFDGIKKFIDKKNLVVGICNGFQIITKLGLLPNLDDSYKQSVSLTENESGHFEDRWVWLKTVKNNSPWLAGIDGMYLPVRHGEGKFITKDSDILKRIADNSQIMMKYIKPGSEETEYPYNPNGSVQDIASISNKAGNVFGLMPHPEAYLFDENHPNWTEGKKEKFTGLKIFQNGIDYFK
jgi:phosphoribosylformylglycinamidine synthase subunit PurQ / glutaminase